ncbi:MAG: alpha-glucosidase, partial [Rhizobacter sp.]|nr:alpha-glucosidase [Rhizobacter sp.]
VTGDIRFIDVPEPVLALVRTPAAGEPGATVLAPFNLSGESVTVSLGATRPSRALEGHGFDGARQGLREGTQLRLPAYGAYFGDISA